MAGRWSVGLAALVTLVFAGQAAAQSFTPDDPRLVEVTAPDRAAAQRLAVQHDVGYETGGLSAVVVVTNDDEIAQLRAEGFKIGRTIEGETIDSRLAERRAIMRSERLAAGFAENGVPKGGVTRGGQKIVNQPGEVVIMRAYTFTNYAGTFLYVEAHSKLGTTSSATTANLSVATAGADGVYGTAVPFTMPLGGDNDPARYTDAGQYMYHRHLQPVPAGTDPKTVRVASDKGGVDEAAITPWLGKSLPPHVPTFQKGFFDHYMDPTEVYNRFDSLAQQFPDIAEIVNMPNPTPGYQRKATTVVGPANFTYTGQTGTFSAAARAQAVALESKEMGHLGGNQLTATLLNPGAQNSPLSITMSGNDIVVNLATDGTGALSSTAAQVVAAINASPGASQLLLARTYAGNAGDGIVQPRALVNLSDFLSALPEVRRGPQTVKLLRIGTHRDGSRTGVFIYAQEHAREWVPPQITIETAERLLRNYAHDGRTKQLVNNLDIFILPSVNPDGGTLSFYDRPSQRRNMTRHCPLTATSGMPSGRNGWGVDVNRNYDVGSLFDGYFGASTSCTSDTYSGPSELSEPESSNLDWVPATFRNIKFSMNTHSSGNLFMWSPGAYVVPGRITLPRPDLGTETFFWSASTHILTEIKRFRNLAVEPTATGPVVDVLYSAAGNSGRRAVVQVRDLRVGRRGRRRGVPAPVGPGGHAQTMEFANGMTGILDVAYAWTFDHRGPTRRRSRGRPRTGAGSSGSTRPSPRRSSTRSTARGRRSRPRSTRLTRRRTRRA